MKNPFHIGVIGAGSCTDAIYNLSRDVGFEIGRRGWSLVCGGLGGVMEGAAKGCIEAGGASIGILPGSDKESANPYIQVPIPTGLGHARNLLIIRASDILIAISGGYGTLSEIGFALKMDKPLIGIETWPDITGVHYVSGFREATQLAENLLEIG